MAQNEFNEKMTNLEIAINEVMYALHEEFEETAQHEIYNKKIDAISQAEELAKTMHYLKCSIWTLWELSK